MAFRVNEMKNRRKFLHLAAGIAALPVVSNITRAQTYPWRPVRIIVGFTAGSATDITARLFAQKLNEAWNVPVTVENIPCRRKCRGRARSKIAPRRQHILLGGQRCNDYQPIVATERDL